MSARQRCDVVGHREIYRGRLGRSAELELKLRCGNTTTRTVHVYAEGPEVPRYVLCSGHTNAQLVAQAQKNHAKKNAQLELAPKHDHFGGGER